MAVTAPRVQPEHLAVAGVLQGERDQLEAILVRPTLQQVELSLAAVQEVTAGLVEKVTEIQGQHPVEAAEVPCIQQQALLTVALEPMVKLLLPGIAHRMQEHYQGIIVFVWVKQPHLRPQFQAEPGAAAILPLRQLIHLQEPSLQLQPEQ